ncbi:MAG TPA: chromosomal replication initiator protein DnaA [Selenomonas sp.]|nr:chromosomal replication initiator protein DnaA [Selenomonadaceae bacterium]HCB94198.1 chromosomal replication initiator protein DnaA [Selenomonas sp.]
MEQEQLQVIWEQIIANMQGVLSEGACKKWLSPVVPISLVGNKITLGTPNDFSKRWIHERYMTMLDDAVFNVIGERCSIDLQNLNLPQEEVAFPPIPVATHGKRRRQKSKIPLSENAPIQTTLIGENGELIEDIPKPDAGFSQNTPAHSVNEPNIRVTQDFGNQVAPGNSSTLVPGHTFDTFVTGKSNQLAHAAALAVAESPGRIYNPFFIYGGVGLGKTHLMHAIGNQIIKRFPEKRVLYVSSETFTNELINAIRDGDPEKFRRKYRTIDVLMVDDVQFISGKPSTQEEFFHTFNALHDSGRAIILSCDRLPHEVKDLEERLRSRFEWGMIADVQPPDLETRIAILKKRSQQGNINVPNDVLITIANIIESNIRELEGALNRVVAHASLTHQPITVDLAEQTLKNLFPGNRTKKITVDMIQNVVASHYNVTVEELHAKKRTAAIVVPRQIAMYLSRELTEASLPQIANFFGKRDHTTVMHACDKISKSKNDDPNLSRTLDELTAIIKKS